MTSAKIPHVIRIRITYKKWKQCDFGDYPIASVVIQKVPNSALNAAFWAFKKPTEEVMQRRVTKKSVWNNNEALKKKKHGKLIRSASEWIRRQWSALDKYLNVLFLEAKKLVSSIFGFT